VTLYPVLVSFRIAVADLPSVAISIFEMEPTIFTSSALAVRAKTQVETTTRATSITTETNFFMFDSLTIS
jgi:hypothetical protein